MKVLLLEDDIIFSELIEEYLSLKGYSVDVYYTIEAAEESIYENKYDLLLMDINLPDGNSLDLLDDFKANGYLSPVIMISSEKEISTLEKSYSFGCDEYITKPFSLEELNIRINYIKKIYKIDFEENIKIKDDLLFDYKNLNIYKEDKTISLPKKEAQIINFFLLNKNRVITIDELVVNLWGYDKEPSIATLRTYIKNIRKYLGREFLENVKGLGYKHTTY